MHIQWPLVFFTLLTGLGAGAFSCVAITDWLGIAQSIRVPGAITALVAMAARRVVWKTRRSLLGPPSRQILSPFPSP